MSVSDALSQVTHVNEQDFLIYSTIANPEKTDLTNLKVKVTKDEDCKREASTFQPPRRSPSRSRTPSLSPVPSFHSRRSRRSRSRSSARSYASSTSRRSRSGSIVSSRYSGSSARSYSRRSRRSRSSYRSHGSGSSYTSHRSRRSRRSHRSARSHSRPYLAEEIFRKGFSEQDPDIIREKEQYIKNLDERRRENPTIPHFTIHDKLEDIEREHNRIYTSEAEKQMVEAFKEGLKFICSTIEWGNNKVGPFLKLHRWSDIVARDVNDKKKYDEPLLNMYRMYFSGRGRMNPFVQLGMLLGTSMLGHHMKMEANPNWDPLSSHRPTAAPQAPPATPYNFAPDQFQRPAATASRPAFPKPPPMQFGPSMF